MRRHHAHVIAAVAGAVAFLPLTAPAASAQALPAGRVHAPSTGPVVTTLVTGDRDHRDKPAPSGSGSRDHRDKPAPSRHHPPAGSDAKPVHAGPGGVTAGRDPEPVHVGPGGVPGAENDGKDTKDDETAGGGSTGSGSSGSSGSMNDDSSTGEGEGSQDDSSTGEGEGSGGAAGTGDPMLPNDRGSLGGEGRTTRPDQPSFQHHLPGAAVAASAVAALGFGSSAAWLAHRGRRSGGPGT
ncbi:hypothetical protein OG883_42330 [Streptomyces sp. NBC_01142]|uniref:hypothetical protein n=1 Tax=Streptomyces sp. NBC_01142 TaxID=2975865 RepID=UPI00225B666E|nr:hypothetical protein [Streptomyces sp. NBC_01142]MCX4826285.1 hypothetical protein [Streptomyces sp. NBC_01142]